jgi:hypothetical protein
VLPSMSARWARNPSLVLVLGSHPSGHIHIYFSNFLGVHFL